MYLYQFTMVSVQKTNSYKKKSEVKSKILNQSPKLITFLLFNYSMLTIRIIEYYSEVENSANTNTEYHYLVPTIRIFE